MLPIFLALLVLGPLFGNAPLVADREIEAERYFNRLYRYFGPPGSQDFEENLGHENAQQIYRGLVEGAYTPEDADHLIRDILRERRRLIPDFHLPTSQERFSFQIQGSEAPEDQPPSSLTLRVYRRPNPLITSTIPERSDRINSGEQPPTTTVPASNPPPAVVQPPNPSESPPQAPVSSSVPGPRTYTLDDLWRRLGQVGIQTSGGARGQYPARLFSTKEIRSDLQNLIVNGGRLESNTRPRAAVALIQLLLIAAGEDLGDDGLDAVNVQGKVNRSLRQFQERSRLPPSGNLTQETLQALLKELLTPRRP